MKKSLTKSDKTVRTFKTFKKWTISTIKNQSFSGSRQDPDDFRSPTPLPPNPIP